VPKSLLERLRVPPVLALLTAITFVAAVCTWVVPSGDYQRETRIIEGHERTVVVPGTFEKVPKHYSLRGAVLGEQVEGHATPVGLHGFLTAIPRGLEQAADIVFFIFIIGGTFGILQRTGTITATIQMLMRRFGHSSTLMTVVVMLSVAVGGSTLGMGEEFIPLVPVFLLISKRLGFDRIFGLAIVLAAMEAGFAAATTNPFTVNIAQGIAELPLNSGIGFRIVFFVCIMSLTILYVLRYGARIKADPAASIMADDPFELDDEGALDGNDYSHGHTAILVSCLAIFGLILFSVQELDWWLADMAGGFFLMGLVAMFVARLPVAEASGAFVKGMEEMVVAALVVGWARGITVVLDDGQILDTLIHSAATVLATVPRYVSAEGMLLFQTTLNFLVPSGSGQAAVTMPLMAPLADVLGLTRQTAVFAFQCGDGFSNVIVPTSGILMAMLALARVPYERWLRFVLPLFGQWLALSAIFLVIAVAIGYK